MRQLKLRCNELESELGSVRREKSTSDQCTDEANKQLQAMKIELSAVHKQLQIVRRHVLTMFCISLKPKVLRLIGFGAVRHIFIVAMIIN